MKPGWWYVKKPVGRLVIHGPLQEGPPRCTEVPSELRAPSANKGATLGAGRKNPRVWLIGKGATARADVGANDPIQHINVGGAARPHRANRCSGL